MKFSPLQKLNVLIIALTISIFILPTLCHATPSTLVIDEFMITGPAGESATSEYVVIANHGPIGVKMDGYSLSRKVDPDDSANTLFNKFTDYILQPGKRVVIAHNNYSGVRDFNYSSSSYSLSPDHTILLIGPDKVVVDMVEMGESSPSSNPFVTPRSGEIYIRTNGVDTDIYMNDFRLLGAELSVDVDPNVSRLVISELLPNPSTGESEWFELHNPTNQNVSLAGLKICDALGSRHCYFFDKVDLLSAGSYKTYNQAVTKITLNNSGDWLELYDVSDNLLADSGGDFGAADKGASLSLFGTEYLWTKSVTAGAQNVFTDTIEIETDTEIPKPKTTKSKVVVATKKSVNTIAADSEENTEAEVKASVDTVQPVMETKKPVNRQTLGWALIWLAILLVVGYTCWYFRDYAKNIYDKIRRRDDSTRF